MFFRLSCFFVSPLVSVTSLIFIDAIDIDKPVFCISFRGCDLLALLLLILVD